MTIRGLFTHFDNEISVEIYDSQEHKENNICSWCGSVGSLKNGSRNTYAYCKVCDWYVTDHGKLIIITK